MTQANPKTQTTRLARTEKTVAAQTAEIEALRKLVQATEAHSKETHDAVARIEARLNQLFLPAPGHDRSLVDRFATATVKIEGAGATLSVLFWIAAGVTAVGGAFLVIRRSILGE